MTVTDKDRGWAKAIESCLKAKAATARDPVAVAGILEGTGEQRYSDGTTVLEAATFAEFGTETAPPRHFVRLTFDRHYPVLRKWVIKLGSDVITQRDTAQAFLRRVADYLRDKIKQTISDGVPPANDPDTLKGKRGSTPLVDSGKLRESVEGEVRGL